MFKHPVQSDQATSTWPFRFVLRGIGWAVSHGLIGPRVGALAPQAGDLIPNEGLASLVSSYGNSCKSEVGSGSG